MKTHIPNILTLLRGVFVIALIPLFSFPFPFQYITIYSLFIIASTTDFLDGYLARKWNAVSDFGKMFDPLIDKLLTIVLFFLFIPYHILPLWVFILFVVRDILVDGMKNFMLSRGIVTPAVFLGKLKFFCIVCLFHCAFLLFFFPQNIFLEYGLWSFALIGLISGFISGFGYTRKFISVLQSHA